MLYGYLLGLFPVNVLHSAVHLAIGAWGIAAWRGMSDPQVYARSLALFYGALAVMGLIPGMNTLFGMLPIHGHDVWLHAGTAAIAAYFGWRSTETRNGTTQPASSGGSACCRWRASAASASPTAGRHRPTAGRLSDQGSPDDEQPESPDEPLDSRATRPTPAREES